MRKVSGNIEFLDGRIELNYSPNSFSYFLFMEVDRLLIDLHYAIETFDYRKLRKVDNDIWFFIEYFEFASLQSYIHEVEMLYSMADSFIHINEVDRLLMDLSNIRRELLMEYVYSDIGIFRGSV